MKIAKGKIISAKKRELFKYYLSRGWDDVYSFPEYIEKMKTAGVKIEDG
jgi:hypothetical protein